MPAFLKSFFSSALSLAPCIIVWIYLIENPNLPVQYVFSIAYAILLWAVLDFIIMLGLEPYRKRLGALTIPSFIATISIILLYIIMAGFNKFIDHLGYAALTPFSALVMLLICVAVFREKHPALKIYISCNGVVLAVLWALGEIDKVTLPF